MGEYTETYYVVKTKDDSKILHSCISKYGRKLAMQDIKYQFICAPDYFTTIEDAKKSAEEYLRHQKTLTARDIKIVKINISIKNESETELLPETWEVHLHSTGWNRSDATKDNICLLLEKQYKVKPISFDIEIKTGDEIYSNVAIAKNIKWS